MYNNNNSLQLAAERVISAFGSSGHEVFIVEGHRHTDWHEAYSATGKGKVKCVPFSKLKDHVRDKSTSGGLVTLVHVTNGVPATSLHEAEQSVKTLTELGDIIVFTPIPVTKQLRQDLLVAWPSFWALLFLAQGFKLHDLIRPAIWYDEQIDWENLQNIVIFTNRNPIVSDTDHQTEAALSIIDYVHPNVFQKTQLKAQNLQSVVTTSPSLETDSGFGISLALPKKYLKTNYASKLHQEQRKWWVVALLAPWRISYWSDLWRLQRRLARRKKNS